MISQSCGSPPCDAALNVLEPSASLEVFATLVGSGLGVGLVGAGYAGLLEGANLEVRPLSGRQKFVSTLLVHRKDDQRSLVATCKRLAKEQR